MVEDVRQSEQQQQSIVRQETGATSGKLPGNFAEQLATLRDAGPHHCAEQAALGNPGGMQEGAATARDDMQKLVPFDALVVMDVSAQNEGFAAHKVEMQTLDHLSTRLARIAERINRIGKHGERSSIGASFIVIAEEFGLT